MNPVERFIGALLDDQADPTDGRRTQLMHRFWNTVDNAVRNRPLAVRMAIAWPILAYLLASLIRFVPVHYGYDALAASFDATACAFLLAFPFIPHLSSAALALVFLVYCLLIDASRDIGCLWNAMLVAQAYIGFVMRPAIGTTLVAAESALCLSAYLRSGRRGAPLLLLILLLLAYVPARYLRWHGDAIGLRSTVTAKRLQAELSDERAEARRRDEMAAVRLHDALTGALAATAMAAETCEETAESPEERSRFRALDKATLDTLRETRQVIDFLTDDGDGGGGGSPPGAATRRDGIGL